VFGWAHSLNNQVREAPWFYAYYFFDLMLAGTVVLIPRAPLVLITLFVQVIATTLLPPALVFLILFLNDKKTMAERVNTRSQNVINGRTWPRHRTAKQNGRPPAMVPTTKRPPTISALSISPSSSNARCAPVRSATGSAR
jgi:hypothetical protein